MKRYTTNLTTTGNSIGNITSGTFGVIAMAIGIINMFWGNDPVYGIFIFLLALVFFPPVTTLVTRITAVRVGLILKILLALFILWTSLGVGELFNKIDLMLQDAR